MEKARIALVDDHIMLRNGMALVLGSIGYSVLFEASNGREMIDRFKEGNIPDIVLMDINMPEMDGFEATLWLKQHHPSVHVMTLTMYEDVTTVIRMLKWVARVYCERSRCYWPQE